MGIRDRLKALITSGHVTARGIRYQGLVEQHKRASIAGASRLW